MAEGPQFDAVPFSAEQPVYLHWLQRPFRHDETKQWTLPVTFRLNNSRLKQDEVSLG